MTALEKSERTEIHMLIKTLLHAESTKSGRKVSLYMFVPNDRIRGSVRGRIYYQVKLLENIDAVFQKQG